MPLQSLLEEISRLHCNGGTLFKRRPDADYRFLPLSEIVRARVTIFGENKDEDGPASMYAICDLLDGDSRNSWSGLSGAEGASSG